MANKPFNPGFEQGKGISARRLQLMRDRRLTGIRGGRGILVREMDDGEGGIQALVETRRGPGIGGGGGDGGTAATSPPPDIADTGVTGTATEYARADHTHGRGLDQLLGVVTDSTASRPTGYAQVAWVTDTIPTNWANNDFCIKKPDTSP